MLFPPANSNITAECQIIAGRHRWIDERILPATVAHDHTYGGIGQPWSSIADIVRPRSASVATLTNVSLCGATWRRIFVCGNVLHPRRVTPVCGGRGDVWIFTLWNSVRRWTPKPSGTTYNALRRGGRQGCLQRQAAL
jgi:hypothetical protein